MTLQNATQYLRPVLPSKLEGTIYNFRELTRELEFDTVVGSGFSGGMLLPILAYRLGLKYALVRKEGWRADSHADRELEGELGDRWLFVDDLVASGATFARCATAVVSLCSTGRHPITFAGGCTYHYQEVWTPEELCSRWAEDSRQPGEEPDAWVATEYPAT